MAGGQRLSADDVGVEMPSVSAAIGEALGISQPAVSQRMKALGVTPMQIQNQAKGISELIPDDPDDAEVVDGESPPVHHGSLRDSPRPATLAPQLLANLEYRQALLLNSPPSDNRYRARITRWDCFL